MDGVGVMTLHKKAEAVASDIARLFATVYELPVPPKFYERVASMLVAFAEAEIKEDRAKHNERTQEVVNEIRNAAYEECAKILTPEHSADYYGSINQFAEAMRLKILALKEAK